ncbi:MAG: M43 family zinc metalloprotease [Bacteroidota bacterium]
MRHRILFIFCLMIGLANKSLSQNNAGVLHADTPRTCATMTQDSLNRIRFPLRPTLDEFEYSINKKVTEINARNAAGKTKAGVVTIPIIVHIIHNGESIGSGLNLSQAQVQAQIEVLNEDMRKKVGTPGFNDSAVGADIEIEFCLSPVDENGKPMSEPGIDRFNGNKSSWTREEIEGSLKSTTIWNPNLFYNIWTLKFGGTSSNLLGYAQFPDQSGLSGLNETGGPASTDGVVIQYTSFGSADKGNFPIMQAPYNKGRTLSHETGHWLGLRHIWGDGNCADDFVSDTPPQASSSSGCPIGRFSCGATNMVENYMDYTNDACMNIFTKGQKTRIQAVIELSPRRKSLIDANLCSPIVADVPTPNFSSDKQLILLGGEINFTDLSSNFPSEWSWTFEGGDPGTSTERNPRIKYSTSGIYKVTLQASNSLGSSILLEKANFITVSAEGLCNTTTNFLDNYTPSFIPLSNYGNYTGQLTGNNSLESKAISEFFANSLGYEFISGVNIQFGQVESVSEEATVTVIVWNARGPQRAPGSVIERKVVLLKQIQEDLANNRPTTIILDRETPVFSKPYQVGIELNYADGNTIAIQSSADGESTNATSWVQDAAGTWQPYAIALGANIAMNIQPIIGMNPSVQISASKLLVYPGEEVALNGRGASIFVWNAEDGTVTNYAGPQLIAHPTLTTTYTAAGSGLDLCNKTANTTIYVRDEITGIDEGSSYSGINLYPNPGSNNLNIVIENNVLGPINIQILSIIGSEVIDPIVEQKSETRISRTIDTTDLRPGLYLIVVKQGGQPVVKKWVKY